MLINPTCLTQVFSDLLLVTKEMKILKPLENFEGYKYLLDSYPALTSASNETKVRFQMVWFKIIKKK